MSKQRVKRRGPVVTEIVEGEPIGVGEKELVPLVRVTSRVQRKAHIGNEHLDGFGWGFVHMQPVAVLERNDTEERRIPVRNETSLTLGKLLVAALAIPVIAISSALLARWIDRQDDKLEKWRKE